MRKLTGSVKCSQDGLEIAENASVKVSLVDCSLMCAPSTTLATAHPKAKGFPFEFELDYDETPLLENLGGQYAIQVRIETDGKLNFITDTQFLITDEAHSKLLDHIDLHVIPVN